MENVQSVLEKNVYSSAFGWSILHISIKFIQYNVLFVAIGSLLMFCLDDLSIDVIGVLKSPTIIAPPYILVLLCWMHTHL